MDGTTGVGVPMVGVLTTHGYGIIGAMELMEVMVGAGTTHGVGTDGTDGTIGVGEVTMVTDGVDGIPLIIMVMDMVMGITVTDIITAIMETGAMADMGIMEITP